eukprot:s6636_g1.t1
MAIVMLMAMVSEEEDDDDDDDNDNDGDDAGDEDDDDADEDDDNDDDDDVPAYDCITFNQVSTNRENEAHVCTCLRFVEPLAGFQGQFVLVRVEFEPVAHVEDLSTIKCKRVRWLKICNEKFGTLQTETVSSST